jgi:hypothetical protein
VLFEFLFGHSWKKLLEAYDMLGGNLWPLVLVVTLKHAAVYLGGVMRDVEASVTEGLPNVRYQSPYSKYRCDTERPVCRVKNKTVMPLARIREWLVGRVFAR